MQPLHPEDPPTIGPYRPMAELGRGPIGRVLLAEGPDAELVTLKLIAPSLLPDDAFRRRISSEVLPSRKALTGRHVAPVAAAGEQAGQPWLASGFVPGLTLAEALAHQGRLDEAAVLRLARDLAAALVQVHEVGLLHRNLKPSNIMLTEDGACLIDFSLARAIGSTDDAAIPRAANGGVPGTRAYMAPEQITGEASTPASDVFSLGTTLFTAATGVNPFEAEHLLQTMQNIVESEPELTGIPERLRGVIGQCLHKDPAERPDPVMVLHLIDQVEDDAQQREPWPEGVREIIRRQQVAITALKGERGVSRRPTPAPGVAPQPTDVLKPARTWFLSPLTMIAAFAVLVLLAVAGGVALSRGGEAGDIESEEAVEELSYPAEPRVYEERPFESLATVGELHPYPYAERAHGQELEIYDGIAYYYYRSNPSNQVPAKTYTGAMDMQTGELLWEREEAGPDGGTWDARWVVGDHLLALWVMEGDFASEFRFLDPASGDELAAVPAGTTEQLDDVLDTYEAPGWFVVSGRLVWVNPSEPDTVYIYDGTGQVERTLPFDRDVAKLGVFTDWDAYLAEPEGDISDGRIWVVTEDGKVAAVDVASGALEPFAEIDVLDANWYWSYSWFIGHQSRLVVFTQDGVTVYEEGGVQGATATGGSGHVAELSICGEFRICGNEMERFWVFDLVEGEFVYDTGEDRSYTLFYVRGVGSTILAGGMDENLDPQTLVFDEQFRLVETLPGEFFPIDESTALETPSSSYGQIEPKSGPVTGLAPQGGDTIVLDAEMEVGGLCDFDAETMICFLMEGLQAYRFRSA